MAENQNDQKAGNTNQQGQDARSQAGNQSNTDRNKNLDPQMKNQGATGSDTGNRNMDDLSETENRQRMGNQEGTQNQKSAQGTQANASNRPGDYKGNQNQPSSTDKNQSTASQSTQDQQKQNQQKDKNNPSGL